MTHAHATLTPTPSQRPHLARPRRLAIAVLGVAALCSGCAVASATVGAAVSVTGAVVAAGVGVTGKAIGVGIDAMSGSHGSDHSGIVVRERVRDDSASVGSSGAPSAITPADCPAPTPVAYGDGAPPDGPTRAIACP